MSTTCRLVKMNILPFIGPITYRQANKIMAYLTFHKWLGSVCNIYNYIWMVQTKTSHLGKVSYDMVYEKIVSSASLWCKIF